MLPVADLLTDTAHCTKNKHTVLGLWLSPKSLEDRCPVKVLQKVAKLLPLGGVQALGKAHSQPFPTMWLGMWGKGGGGMRSPTLRTNTAADPLPKHAPPGLRGTKIPFQRRSCQTITTICTICTHDIAISTRSTALCGVFRPTTADSLSTEE